ncbi:MAG: anti-ECFsigma factor, ChrR [Acidobacteriales bacterium]|nr:anti-ECFsigma factor, ChrR [Terriglobales bacterium]
MNCKEFENLLPDFLQDSLSGEQLTAAKLHGAECADCREMIALWGKLSTLPEEHARPALRARFEAMLNAFQEGRWEHEKLKSARNKIPSWGFADLFRAPAAQVAFAMLFMVIGVFVGRYLDKPAANTQELAALHQEVSSMRQLVVLSLLQQQSASERLQGVNWSLQVNRADPEILSALLHTLRFDSSVDVKLAALDALRKYNTDPQVRKGLVDALQAQQSPMVQIALIDTLVELHESDAVEQIKKFQKSPNLNPTVRQRAEWGINKLSRG